MRAVIVSASTREPLARHYYAFPWNGDLAGRPLTARSQSTAGTLWERVADATFPLNDDVLTDAQWRRMCVRRNELGTRGQWAHASRDERAERGPRFELYPESPLASGVIQAGRRRGFPYSHTGFECGAI